MNNILKLENQVCFPVYAFSREVTNLYKPFLDKLNLTYPQYLVMLILWEEKQQTVNQLGEKLYLDSGTLTPLLKRMEHKGVLTRTRSRADERVVLIATTEIGEKMQEQAALIPEQLVAALGLSIDELQQLKKIVNKALLR
ncbi:MarR family transcriptional regulator [Pedobacter petrophilus]|uniref:HTH-type transcriptional regulator SarZ n=1 Tax=Pedobacter petrophilus TaxID=1908241 RepID=A0A7K0G0H6_9SPHI|nr:MarR family transcriptional regulator [Pedobacter petrophilus]MRX76496.1 MarR family transcriptional regulator [Pedobacter petrophilus]